MTIRVLLIRAAVVLPAILAQWALAQNDWPVYGRDPGAQRYAPLTQINAGNVSTLVQAWTFNAKPSSESKAKQASKSTPLVVNNVMYLATPFQSLVAVEPETGKKVW